MAVAFRSADSATTQSPQSVGCVVTKPAGTVDNDILVAVMEVSNGGRSFTPPAGWTQLDIETTGPSTATFWKLAASEGATFTFTANQDAVGGTCVVAAYSGADTASPINQHGALNRVTSSTSPAATSITPSVDNCMLVWLSGSNANGPYSPPATYTERAENGGGADATSAQISDLLQGAAAATGTVTGTCASGNSQSGLIAIAPALSTSTATVAWITA